MPILFKSQPKPSYQAFEPIVMQALGTDKIVDTSERHKRARELLSTASAPAGPAPILWGRIAITCVLLVVLFILGTAITNQKASETLFNCFQPLFTATLGLFGIEAATNGSANGVQRVMPKAQPTMRSTLCLLRRSLSAIRQGASGIFTHYQDLS
jgi:hypothetical protein